MPYIVVEEAKPLLKLGPFGVTKAKVFLSFPSKSEAGMYRVDFRTKLSVLQEWVLPTGCHGPISNITLSMEDREKIGIPKEATFFCWCYPPAGMEALSPERKQNLERYVRAMDPEFTFLAFGGFVYFSQTPEGALQVLRAYALAQGGLGILFDPPLPWRSEFTDYLYRQGRFQGVTIQALKDVGLHQYCYINPNEELLNTESGDTWTPCPHGGFVYLYNNNSEPHPLDRFFPQSPTTFCSPEDASSSSSSPSISPSSSPSRALASSSGSIPFSMIVRAGTQTPTERGRSNTFSSTNTHPNSNNNSSNNNNNNNNSSYPITPVVAERDRSNTNNNNNNNNYNLMPNINNNSISSPAHSPTHSPTLNSTHAHAQTVPPMRTPGTQHTCVVCWDQPVSVLILPCKHICVCATCGPRLNNGTCPLCRGDIRETWNVYL